MFQITLNEQVKYFLTSFLFLALVLWNRMKIKASTDIHHVVITKDGVDTMGAVSDFASADVITPHVYIKRNHAWKHPAVAVRFFILYRNRSADFLTKALNNY